MEKICWKDNLGNVLEKGEKVLVLTGAYAYTIQTIKQMTTKNESLFIRAMVTLEVGSTLTAYNVVSLGSLGVDADAIDRANCGKVGFDCLGNKLSVGDKVLYLHKMEAFMQVGTVEKLTDKSCILSIEKNRFDQVKYRTKYAEIISLSALQKDDFVPNGSFD